VRVQSNNVLDRFNRQPWLMTHHVLIDHATFHESDYSFMLKDNPFSGETIHPGPYRIGKNIEDANTYRVGHPLAQRVLDRAKAAPTPVIELTFQLTGSGKNIAILMPFIGRQGWLRCTRLSVRALEVEEHLLFSAVDDDGQVFDESQCRRMFDLLAAEGVQTTLPANVAERIKDIQARAQASTLQEMGTRNARWFETEIEKLEHWAEDRRATLKAELDELDEALKTGRKSARTAPTLPEKLERQREVRRLETRRDDAWRAFDQATRDLDKQKDALLDDIARRLEHNVEDETLFTIRWRIA
jgi:hypothetical protein